MHRILKLLLFAFLLYACKSKTGDQKSNAVFVPEKTTTTSLLEKDSTSIRALHFDPKEHKAWFAASNGFVGFVDVKNKVKKIITISNDGKIPQFRSSAATTNNIFILSIESPGLLYKIDKKTLVHQLVYEDARPGCFFDSMAFWDEKYGIAMGDAINNEFNIILTSDGGTTWKPIPVNSFPKVSEGEGGFAASNSCIALHNDTAWIFSGGSEARCFKSTDKGKSWSVFETKMIQGSAMQGIFSGDFYDENIGFVVGGDYENPTNKKANKNLTLDGGRTWNEQASGQGFGYASCVKFIPNKEGKELFVIANDGLFYSKDYGASWKLLHAEKDLYTLDFISNDEIIIAGKNKIKLLKFGP